ncbi:unnamed protein product [Linum trigynum]|uniref:RNase H type-1 domain-containing protein n=1 Tax=Linum trigynum TaxID=586398 RepID=A0AAV2DDP3_9ROSI
MNVDATMMKGEGTGFGVAVRDENEDFLLDAVHRERTICPPELAEIKTIAFGLQQAEMHDFHSVIAETDCEVAFLALQRMSKQEWKSNRFFETKIGGGDFGITIVAFCQTRV